MCWKYIVHSQLLCVAYGCTRNCRVRYQFCTISFSKDHLDSHTNLSQDNIRQNRNNWLYDYSTFTNLDLLLCPFTLLETSFCLIFWDFKPPFHGAKHSKINFELSFHPFPKIQIFLVYWNFTDHSNHLFSHL